MRRPTKKQTERIARMIERLDAKEERQQKIFGDRVKGSARSSDVADAESLRNLLAWYRAIGERERREGEA